MYIPITSTNQPKAGLSFSPGIFFVSELPMYIPVTVKSETRKKTSSQYSLLRLYLP